jgi:aspartate racemase
MLSSGNWDSATALMIDAARRLEAGGAEALVICTNTMHRIAPALETTVDLPLIHIADATVDRMKAADATRPALLATRFTMEQPFYAHRLREGFGLDPQVPDEAGRSEIHRIIYEELCRGIVTGVSRQVVLGHLDRLRDLGADSVILGCTELTMLLGPEHVDLPLFDTTRLHAEAAVAFVLAESP